MQLFTSELCHARWPLCVSRRPSRMHGSGKGSYGRSIGSKGSKGNSKGKSKGTTKGPPGPPGSPSNKLDVLVIGAGCTGALVAALLRSEARRRGASTPRVALWEWGRGPAGRMTSFWSERTGSRIIADVGAQVISLEDPARLPAWMEPEVRVAENLSETTERRAEWFHFHAAEGLPRLQRASLEKAELTELHFNRRVMSLNHDGRWWASYSERGSPRSAQWEDFELLIFAGTAQDALNLSGLREALSPEQQQAMRGVRYDHRLALALILTPHLAPRVEKLCHGRSEVVVEDSAIHLVARQDVKGRSNESGFAVVMHSTVAFAASNLQLAKQQNRPPKDLGSAALLAALAELLQMQVVELEKEIIDRKVVHWRQCQVQKPLQGRPEAGAAMLVDPMLILAGDYLAEDAAGSFQGCLDSAEAAASMACDLLYGVSSSQLPVRRWGKQLQEGSASASGKRWRARAD